ncbi:MAG TPA: chemotaxis protein, partial [Pirellulaceae bacterium]|nr:chemotaxis protein [Pirellulaceae bacterium]
MAASSALDTGILLEAGTNEFEILVFYVRGQAYGVNVAKVREVLSINEVTIIPRCHEAIEGMVRIRSEVVMLVDLGRYLHDEATEIVPSQRMLLLEFNNQLLAFRVDGVDRIVRASWNQGAPLPETIGAQSPITSVVLLKDRMLLMLDFESVAAQIGIAGTQHAQVANTASPTNLHALPIVFAEDSRMISEMLRDELQAAGFTNLHGFPDGKEAWDYLVRLSEGATPENIRQRVAGIVTDVEMPRIDGLNLTRRVREHAVLKQTPVVLFSSLVSR